MIKEVFFLRAGNETEILIRRNPLGGNGKRLGEALKMVQKRVIRGGWRQ